jgi:hypothetical protein
MGAFSLARTFPSRKRAAVASAGALALAGVLYGGGTAAQAGDLAAVQAGTGCPSSVIGGVAAGTTTASPFSWPGAGPAGVPWRSVGRGWILADLAKSASARTRATVYLVSPGGQRYRLGPAPANATLYDWSGDGTRAVFFAQPVNSYTTGTITVLNLHTGQASSFTVLSGTPYPNVAFTRPAGTAILFAGSDAQGDYLPLQRLSLTGARELCYPTRFPRVGAAYGGYLENATGTEVVFSAQNGLEVASNTGQPIRALITPGWANTCNLLNWWSNVRVLADCSGQLQVIPLSGARPDQLTSSRDIAAFLGAWHLRSGIYAEAAACGTTWLERLNSNGTATVLTIPGAANAGTVHPLGTYRNQLPLLIGGGCGPHFPFSFVDWYNPSSNAARTVIGGPAGGGYVTGAVLYPAGP